MTNACIYEVSMWTRGHVLCMDYGCMGGILGGWLWVSANGHMRLGWALGAATGWG